MNYGVILLAAGKGTRMNSALPKVMHKIGGKPMLSHLFDTVDSIGCQQRLVVCGFGKDKLQQTITNKNITWVEQKEQSGTGHAVLQTLEHLIDEHTYLILVGDAPLVQASTLQSLLNCSVQTGIAVLTITMDNPTAYGRIIKDAEANVIAIVEEKDATEQQKQIKEVNSGIFAIKGHILKNLLPKIQNNNSQKEYYLTDIVALATANAIKVKATITLDASEVFGCNDKNQLAQLERMYQQRQSTKLLQQGVTLLDPARIDIRGQLQTGQDCEIDINCIFIGNVTLGNNVKIAANCIITDSTIGDNTIIKANSVIEQATIAESVEIGPFARIRPKTHLAANSKVGNFVETKNAKIGKGSKISHLSYIGDAILGEKVNVGAGTITCNYDGKNKFQTNIDDCAFIGSNSSLVAPVSIGKNATVGAGSVITSNVTESSLAIARSRQINIKDWNKKTNQDNT